MKHETRDVTLTIPVPFLVIYEMKNLLLNAQRSFNSTWKIKQTWNEKYHLWDFQNSMINMTYDTFHIRDQTKIISSVLMEPKAAYLKKRH